MKLGETSTTADEEGEKTVVSDMRPSHDAVESALQKFTGDIMQTPPVFSAMKVGGVRAYKLARSGAEVTMEARPARIYSNQLTSYDYPLVRFTSRVGSGTYIRSLVEDFGRELGSGAYMSDLRRTTVGNYDVADAATVESIDAETLRQLLLPLAV